MESLKGYKELVEQITTSEDSDCNWTTSSAGYFLSTCAPKIGVDGQKWRNAQNYKPKIETSPELVVISFTSNEQNNNYYKTTFITLKHMPTDPEILKELDKCHADNAWLAGKLQEILKKNKDLKAVDNNIYSLKAVDNNIYSLFGKIGLGLIIILIIVYFALRRR